MSAPAIMQMCAELGIKLALKGEDNDRLQVDTPKGVLTTAIREAITAQKTDIIAALKSKQVSPKSQLQIHSQDPDTTVTRTPASTPTSPEATFLILEQPLADPPGQFDRVEVEVNKLLSGSDYDSSIVGSKDPATRQNVSAQLLAALARQNSAQQGRARQAFLNHGFFNDAATELQSADSPAERAGAARKLGAVRSPKAIAPLVASLEDRAPEVRRAAVESLGQLGDPSAVPLLNELLSRETSHQLPSAVIRDAINAIAFHEGKHPSVSESSSPQIVESEEGGPQVKSETSSSTSKREISAEYLSSFENRLSRTSYESSAPSVPTSNSFDAAEEQLRQEEEALRRAADALERKRSKEAPKRAAKEAQQSAEEDVRYRLEAETLRKAAEKLARKRSEAAAVRKRAEAEAAEQPRLRAAEEARVQAAEEARRPAPRRAEEEYAHQEALERHLAEEAQLRHEQETLKQVAAELARRRSELDEARQRAEVEARLLTEAEELAKAEQETRQQEVERQRLEAQARRRAEEEQLEEARRRAAEERQQAAELARILAEEEAQRLAGLELAKTQAEEIARRMTEQEQRITAEIFALSKEEEEQRRRIEAEINRRNEVEARLEELAAKAEAEAYRVAEELRLKAEEQARRRAEAEARVKEEQLRLRAEEEARVKAEAEARRLAEAARERAAAEEALLREEIEARLKEEEARLKSEMEARERAEAEAQRLAEETRVQAEEAARRRRAEAEARLIEAEARLQAEHEASARAEEEAQRLAEETRQMAEQEALRRAEAEARLKAEQERLTSDEQDLTDAFAAGSVLSPVEDAVSSVYENSFGSSDHEGPAKEIDAVFAEKGIVSAEADGRIPSDILERLKSPDANVREAALSEVVKVGGEDAFRCIGRAFDDQSVEVRNAAALALFDLHSDRAAAFTRALREGTPERRRKIGQALAASGLAKDAIGNLTGENREKTYDAFSLLFLMAKAGEVQPLMQAIEDYPNLEIRIAVVKLLALSGQPDIVPAFRRMAVRGSLPSEVRSAVMEAIYQIGTQARESPPSAA